MQTTYQASAAECTARHLITFANKMPTESCWLMGTMVSVCNFPPPPTMFSSRFQTYSNGSIPPYLFGTQFKCAEANKKSIWMRYSACVRTFPFDRVYPKWCICVRLCAHVWVLVYVCVWSAVHVRYPYHCESNAAAYVEPRLYIDVLCLRLFRIDLSRTKIR